MQASFCLHLLFSTFAIIHGTLKISSFHLTEFILQFLDYLLLFYITIEETRQNKKHSLLPYINANKNLRENPLGFYIS